ncbi:MAG TPA: glycosyltransferase, partial [Coleofasciculaceae cyanobacterium]
MPGGIETHVQTLARAQADLGADVRVFCVNGLDKKKGQSLRTQTVEALDENVRVTSLGRIFSFARFDICPDLLTRLEGLVDQPNTILHVHTPNPTMLTALMMLRPRTPVVITHHSDIIKQRLLKYAFRPVEHLVYRQASRILTTSTEYIEGSKFLRLYKHRLSSLPLGLECSRYRQPSPAAHSYARRLQETYRGPLWLTVGRLVYYKALDVAIEALKFVP